MNPEAQAEQEKWELRKVGVLYVAYFIHRKLINMSTFSCKRLVHLYYL